MSIEAMKQALEALEKLEKHNRGVKITTVKTGEVIHPAQIAQEAITSLRQAIAEAEKQEPDDLTVAYMSGLHDGKKQRQQEPCPYVISTKEGTHYCSLSHREPLTDEQIAEVRANRHWLTAKDKAPYLAGIRDAEAAHGIKGET